MSYDRLLSPGDTVTGRWNGAVYEVQRCLGAGANGQVYLVKHRGEQLALKLGYEAIDFQSEINGLTELQKQGDASRKFVRDTDDITIGDKRFPFYVMKYVPGIHPARFLYENGMDWYPVIGFRVLTRLAELHERGYIFGDLKSDNILVSGYGTVELIDYGGLTKNGKAVRQFSERYDRGYWRAGTRVADTSYDLFAFAVMCMELADPEGAGLARLEADSNRSERDLCRLADELPGCRKVAPVLRACLTGKYTSALQAQCAWRRSVYASEDDIAGADQELTKRSSIVLTVSLAATFLISLTVFGAVLYWTLNPGLLP